LGVFYLYIRLRIGPHLLYHQQCPVFLTTLEFLKSFLDRPGGLLAYVSVFLAQFSYYPSTGALVLTLTASLICLSTDGLLRVLAGRRVPLPVVLLPAVGLLLLHNRYQYDPTTGTTVLVALALVNAYVRWVPRRTRPGFTVFLVSSVIVYAVGGSAYVLYAVLCGVFELVKKRRILLGVFCLLCTAAPYGFSMYSYEVGPAAAYVPLLPFREGASLSFRGMLALPRALHMALLLFFPLAAVTAGLHARRTDKTRTPVPDGSPPHPTPPPATASMLLSLGLFSAVAATAVLWSFDDVAKTRLEIDYHAQRGQWKLVLEKARSLPPARWTDYVMHDVNRALYHTGRLLEEMFSYPQTRDVDSLLLAHVRPAPQTGRVCLKIASLYFELGHINRAQGSAHIALEILGEHPEVLKLLAKIYIIKGQTPMARTCLGALSQNLLYRNEAKAWLDRLDIDPDMTADTELERVRTVTPRTDPLVGSLDVSEFEGMFLQLLRTNPRNRMAFEYGMAYFLWSGQVANVVASLGRLNNFDYSGIPRHCEEAVMAYQRANREGIVNLYGRRISDETLTRAREFFENLARYVTAGRLDRESASKALAERYGNSYFFYRVFGFCGSGARPVQADVVTGASK
jgi:tetratricopeptide (TPR) repeat protein